METKPENFGQFVQQKRLEKGLTQKQLASKVSCSVDTIRAIEQNRSNYVPSGQMIAALAQALEVSEDELKGYLKAKENVAYVPPKRQPNYVLLATSVLIAAVLITAAFFILTSLPQGMVGAIFAPALAQTPTSVKTPTPTLSLRQR